MKTRYAKFIYDLILESEIIKEDKDFALFLLKEEIDEQSEEYKKHMFRRKKCQTTKEQITV